MRFKQWLPMIVVGLVGAGLSPVASALNIFACEPEWAALATELAPDATIVSATHARQDPHYIEARPSLIAKLRRADLAVCTGAELEAGWLPVLQQRAGNANVKPGRNGMLFVSDLVTLIDKKSDASRADGDVHPGGNPHIHLDPVRLVQIAKGLVTRLQTIDTDNAAAYQTRYDTWVTQWEQHTARWTRDAAPLRGRAIVAQHSTFAYLWQWLGMTKVADLEPKPGLPPTPAHLASLVEQVKQSDPVAIVQTLYHDQTPVQWLHERTGVASLSLASTVTDEGKGSTLHGLFDILIAQLLATATESKR